MPHSIQNNGEESLWQKASPYLVPPLSATAAMIPAFYGFTAKSARQTDKKIPSMKIREYLSSALRSAPLVGMIVGVQLTSQQACEKFFKKERNNNDLFLMLASALTVGVISVPFLAIFNGKTLGKSMSESLRQLSLKQTGAIVIRETSFLFSLRVSEPFSKIIKDNFGERKAVDYTAGFSSGFIGSLIGHPADTALTRWQQGLKIEKLIHLRKGALIKALATGIFSITYEFVDEHIR